MRTLNTTKRREKKVSSSHLWQKKKKKEEIISGLFMRKDHAGKREKRGENEKASINCYIGPGSDVVGFRVLGGDGGKRGYRNSGGKYLDDRNIERRAKKIQRSLKSA